VTLLNYVEYLHENIFIMFFLAFFFGSVWFDTGYPSDFGRTLKYHIVVVFTFVRSVQINHTELLFYKDVKTPSTHTN